MDLLKEYAIVITSYEISKDESNNNNYTPIISHVFWGNNIKQALGYAKSHLVTDYFFSSTIAGDMLWKGKTLEMGYEGKIITVEGIARRGITNDIMDEISEEMERIIKLQEDKQIPEIINEISLLKDK